MSVLTVENLGFTYPGSRKPVLKNVNATFAPGKTYAVTGPSGSGKSTLLSLLAGLEKPTEGRISVDGEDLADLDPDRYRREKVAFVFQSYQLMPLLTACENVALPMEMRGIPVSEADARAKELLESVGLPESLRRRFPGNLSGGEQQRVGIARSLASGNFDTQKVLSMQKMFIDCQELKSIDLKSFTNPKLTNIEEMFSGCTSLSSLDMSSFNSKLITDMDNAFNGVSIEGKIIYNSTIFTENLISQIPEKWEKIDIKNGN